MDSPAPDSPTPPTRTRILLVGSDAHENTQLQQALERAEFVTYLAEDVRLALDIIYNEPPDAIVLSRRLAELSAEGFAMDLKTDNVFGHLPIILVIPESDLAVDVDWSRVPVDDFITAPVDPVELVRRMAFTLARAERELGSNPLTRLPGNDSIIKEIQRRLDRQDEFGLVYVDVDNFKSFNDKYGFSRGDEVLRMIARVLINAIRSLRERGGYVGHVGGDDFVLCLPLSECEGTCAQIIGNFDLIVPTFYNEEDRTRGYIDAQDRQGKVVRFPLMTLTLGVVPNEQGRLRHYGEASAIAAELKKHGKTLEGSNFVVDRRQSPRDGGLQPPPADMESS